MTMKRDGNDWEDDEELEQMLPENLGIDIGEGPDVILGRYTKTGEPPPRRRDEEGELQRFGPYVPYLTLEQLSDLKPAEVAWLWPGRIAMARLTLIAGESQVGKSLVALDVAARVSRGALWPDAPSAQPAPAGNVLVLGMNRAAAADVVARLTRAGADMSKVFFADGIYLPETSDQGWKRPLSLADDL